MPKGGGVSMFSSQLEHIASLRMLKPQTGCWKQTTKPRWDKQEMLTGHQLNEFLWQYLHASAPRHLEQAQGRPVSRFVSITGRASVRWPQPLCWTMSSWAVNPWALSGWLSVKLTPSGLSCFGHVMWLTARAGHCVLDCSSHVVCMTPVSEVRNGGQWGQKWRSAMATLVWPPDGGSTTPCNGGLYFSTSAAIWYIFFGFDGSCNR